MHIDYTHLNPFEPAARIFCQLQQQDADEPLRVPHPLGLTGVEYTRPAWHFAAENLINISQMLTALKMAAELTSTERLDEDGKQLDLFDKTH